MRSTARPSGAARRRARTASRHSAATLALAALFVLVSAPPRALAFHSPHDVMTAWALSPDFQSDRTLFVAASRFQLLLRSRDGGLSYETVNRGLRTGAVQRIAFSSGFAEDRTIYCAENVSVYRSRDGGDSWHELDVPAPVEGPRALLCRPREGGDGEAAVERLLVGTASDGVWTSDDGGRSWRAARWPEHLRGPVEQILLAGDGQRLIARCGPDVLLASDDGGDSFAPLCRAPTDALAWVAAGESRDDLLIATLGDGVLRTRDAGESWTALEQGLGDHRIVHVVRTEGSAGEWLWASSPTAGLFRREGDGPWVAHDQGLRSRARQSPSHYFAVMTPPRHDTVPTAFAVTFEGLHVAHGDGAWRYLSILPRALVRDLALSPAYAHDRTLWLSTYGLGLLASDDGGRSLRRLDTGRWRFPDGVGPSPAFAEDRTLMVGVPADLRLSTDGGLTWRNAREGELGFGREIAFAPDYATSGTLLAYISLAGDPDWHGLLRSDDRARTWTEVGPAEIYELAYSPRWETTGRVWAASPTGMHVSADRGRSWERLAACPSQVVLDVAVARGSGAQDWVVGCGRVDDEGAVFVSTDGGASWELRRDGLERTHVVRVAVSPALAEDGLIFAGTHDDGVHVSRDAGRTWTRAPGSPGPHAVLAMAISPTFAADRTLVVGGYEGAWITEDDGASWRRVDPRTQTQRRDPTPREKR